MRKIQLVELLMALSDPWAMAELDFRSMFNSLCPTTLGTRWPAGEALSQFAARSRQQQTQQPPGKVAVLSIRGVIANRAGHIIELLGGTSYERIGQAFDVAEANTDVSHIVLDIDSPGGSIFGAQELATKIAASSKPTTAVANHVAGSSAYWLASQADELVVSPSGQVGDIGVYAIHTDSSGADAKEGLKRTLIKAGKYKAEGVVGPLSDDARAAVQEMLDEYHQVFVAAVARGRGVNAGTVANGFGEGRMVLADEALSLGMVDRVGTLDQVLESMMVAT